MTTNNIVRPVTDDGMVGYDGFGQFVLVLPTEHGTIIRPIEDVRSKPCAICQQWWAPTGPAMADQHFWNLIGEHVHRTCLVRHMGFVERAEFSDAISWARLRHRGLRVRENGYGGSRDEWSRSWYYVELMDVPARIDIGWRKRVISIEIQAQGGIRFDWWEEAQALFVDEDVTKEFGPQRVLLHAWGVEKMRIYLQRLTKFLSKEQPG